MKQILLKVLLLLTFVSIGAGIYHFVMINADTFTPEISKDIDFIIIKNEFKENCYIEGDKRKINVTINSLKHLSEHIFDEIPDEKILFIKNGLIVDQLPFSHLGFPDSSLKRIDAIKTAKNKKHLFAFTYQSPLDFPKLKLQINEKYKNFIIVYPDENYNSLHPYIEVTYKDHKRNFKGISDKQISASMELGKFIADDKLIPVRDYIKNAGLLYSTSKVRFREYITPGEFYRSIRFYLNKEVDSKEIEKIRKLAPTADSFYDDPFEYNNISKITFYIISPNQPINKAKLRQEFNLK